MTMRAHRYSSLASALAIALVLHPTVYAVAAAQTSTHMSDSAGLANDPIFKPTTSSLYSSTSTDFTAGGQTVPISDLFSGIPPTTPTANALPNINSQEDLYIHRDVQIGHMENSTGQFSSTGTLQAEQQSVEILKNMGPIPDFSNETWIDPSRTLVSDQQALRAGFADCSVTHGFTTTTASYTNTVTETCEVEIVDGSAITASRNFQGTDRPWSKTTFGGIPHCSRDGTNIRVTSHDVCRLLGAFEYIDPGLAATNCTSGDNGCIELTRTATPPPFTDFYPLATSALQSDFPTEAAFCARFNCSFHFSPGTWASVTYKPAVTANFFYCNKSSTTPTTYNAPPSGSGFFRKLGECIKWVDKTTNNTVCAERALGELCFGLFPDIASNQGTSKIQETISKDAGRAYLAYLRYGPPTGPSYSADRAIKFLPNVPITGAVARTLTGSNTALSINGTAHSLPNDGSWKNFNSIFAGSPTREWRFSNSAEAGESETVAVRVYFDARPFSDWFYPAVKGQYIKDLAQLPNCEFAYNVTASADANADGCIVGANAPASTADGRICGNNIGNAPFTLPPPPDPAATTMTVWPNCDIGFYPTKNSCTPFESDPDCSFDNSTCLESTSDGSCWLWQYEYSCGTTFTYNVPQSTETISCSGLSCLGEDCVINTSTSAATDLAEAASRLAALDLIASDLNCEALAHPPDSEIEAEAAIQNCELFPGEAAQCKRVVLGLANCCKEQTAVSLVDYLQLAFATSRLNASLGSLGVTTPITSAWVSFKDMSRNSFSQLTQPLTQTWESIVGNTGIAQNGAAAFSVEGAKQALMRSAAEWVQSAFGDAAVNALFQQLGTSGGSAILSNGTIAPNIGLSASVTTVMSAVSAAYTAYMVVVVLAGILFACNEEEIELGVKRALRSTHYIGRYCDKKFLGACTMRKDSYCTYNTPLARILNQQIKAQLGMNFGTPKNPDCSGLSVAAFLSADMAKVDLSEWTGIMASTGLLDHSKVIDIEEFTGTKSTLGEAQSDLYPRENALVRNQTRLANADFAALREDARNDMSGTQPPPVDQTLSYSGFSDTPSIDPIVTNELLTESAWSPSTIANSAGGSMTAGYSTVQLDFLPSATSSSPSLLAFQIDSAGAVINVQLVAKNTQAATTVTIGADPTYRTHFAVIHAGSLMPEVNYGGTWSIDPATRAVARNGVPIGPERMVFMHDASWNPGGHVMGIRTVTTDADQFLFGAEDANTLLDPTLLYNDGVDVAFYARGSL